MLVNRKIEIKATISIFHLLDFQRGEKMMGRWGPLVVCQRREYKERQLGSVFQSQVVWCNSRA